MQHISKPGITRMIFKAVYPILVTAFMFPVFARSPQTGRDSLASFLPTLHQERPDDPYVTVPREARPTSPAYRFSSPNIITVQVNVNAQGQNIVGDAANEPSLAIDPTDSSRMVIGWRQFDTVNNNFRQAGYAYSIDGGQSWTFPGVIDPGVFRSDPVLSSDAEGNFYYNSLTVNGSDFLCTVFKSTDGGATWDSGIFARGGDKQWMIIDKTGGAGRGHIYAYWTQSFSICFPGFFTRSTNNAASFEDCVEIPNQPFWGTLAIGPEGELYVAGAGGNNFVVAKSSNAKDSSQVVSWDFASIVNLDGSISAFAGSNSPNPGGLLGQAWVAVDRSGGPYHGNVYLLCSVNRFSNPDPLDVMFARSTDGGLTWSAPLRVNDDPSTSAWQWFGTMSVAPNGRIDAVWLDTRDNPGSVHSSLYYSCSTDGGVSWSANERLSNAFNPHLGWPQQNKLGDYFDMISDDAGAHLAWANTFNGEQDIYYSYIQGPPVGIVHPHAAPEMAGSFSLSQNYPNPFNPGTRIAFSLSKAAQVAIEVFNIRGEKIATLLNQPLTAGSYDLEFDGSGLANGVYLYRMKVGNTAQVRKMLLIK